MKKLNICLFHVVLLCIMLLFSANAFALEGDGSQAFPFLITNEEELSLINDFPECHFKLMNDIEMKNPWKSDKSTIFSGVFDGNGHTISNMSSYDNSCILFPTNKGIIHNLTVGTSTGGVYCGIISLYNYGTISQCKTTGKVYESSCNSTIIGSTTWTPAGGIAAYNYKPGVISQCTSFAFVSGRSNIAGGIAGYNSGLIENCYYIGKIKGKGYISSGSIHYADMVGIAYNGEIRSCYAIPEFTNDGYTRNYAVSNSKTVYSSFYDNRISSSSTQYATAKSALAMKIKQTYTGWDFENVWGISPDLNDGYPYLLWEQEAPTVSKISVEISSVAVTSDKMKFISKASIDGNPAIDSFGTTFIPLQLFNNAEANVAIVQYDNSKYNISNGQTFGALLSDIPSSCKDVPILGKSFIKDSDGNYTWSAAKYASINDPILRESN